MRGNQLIVVCTEDSVLAKKVRFLLARDECEVEILGNPVKLERRLKEGGISLLILSRNLGAEDSTELLARWEGDRFIPPAIVLGGEPALTSDSVTIISDPIDTQAIYRLASEMLSNAPIPEMQLAAISSATDPHIDRTMLVPTEMPDPELETAQHRALNESDFPSSEDIMNRLGVSNGDDDETIEPLNDELVPSESELEDFSMAEIRGSAPTSSAVNHLGLAGVLEPARFAKVLFQCWTMEAHGALVVAGEDETLTIFFEDGFPIHVESNIPGDLLGRTLSSKGKLTDSQYGESAKLAIERGLTLGMALVELGHVSREALGRELGEDAHERIVRKFAARAGAFEFDPNRPMPRPERPYRIPVGRILVDGLRRHCDDDILNKIVGNIESRYYRLRATPDEIAKRFPLAEKEREFLHYFGRAYNVSDASEVCGLNKREARVLMSLLLTCEEVEDFTPGVSEFEARIREERERQKAVNQRAAELEAKGALDSFKPAEPAPSAGGMPKPSVAPEPPRGMPPVPPPSAIDRTNPMPPLSARPTGPLPAIPPAKPAGASGASVKPTGAFLPSAGSPGSNPPIGGPSIASLSPPNDQTAPPGSLAGPTREEAAPPNGSASIPPMPVPPNGTNGRVPRVVVFSAPLPKGPDGQPQETIERTRSRQHFQRGVTLLGQGNFDEAEVAFRDAIALCSEEHVYLIGLARAIYYNPSYTAPGKLPVLREIVGRASALAPDDGRVTTLIEWVRHAEP